MRRTKLPPHVNGFTDRHGKSRYYFRRQGFKAASLGGLPHSTEFMDAYALAGATTPRQAAAPIGQQRRSGAGSVDAVVASYLSSVAFGNLAEATKRTRRYILDELCRNHGPKRVAQLESQHIAAMVAAKSGTPSAARNFLIAMRALMQHAIETRIRSDDPTIGIKRVKIKTKGYRTWTVDDIAAFEATHPVGSRARLALAILLYTVQRRGHIIGMGRQHVRNGVLFFRQQKTGVALELPILPELRAAIDATPSEHLTLLTTSQGKPLTAQGFTNWFRDCCVKAGLPKGSSTHGLRKAACTRLANAGRSAHEIAAWSGHTTLREVERYTRAADQSSRGKTR